VVLVEKATETVAAVDRAHMRFFLWLVGGGRAKFKGTMRPLAVVMVDVGAEHAFEVASVEDQQPVEAVRVHLFGLPGNRPDSAAAEFVHLTTEALTPSTASRRRVRT